MAQKIFKTIDEQITILRDKGLIINDVDFAKVELVFLIKEQLLKNYMLCLYLIED